MKAPILELYYFEACPYCQLVLRVVEELKIKVELKDIRDNLFDLQKLIHITGRKTVPCLFINGDPMHESQDIMQWLRINVKNLEKAQ